MATLLSVPLGRWPSGTGKLPVPPNSILEIQGRPLGPNDLKIAANARTHGLTLVSADQEFSRMPGLNLADWTLG
jgi:hypothetical protein